jgi:very-short-patch-repair endonuclease
MMVNNVRNEKGRFRKRINLDENLVIKTYQEKKSLDKTCKEFNVNRMIIYRILKKNNIERYPAGNREGNIGWNRGLTKETDKRLDFDRSNMFKRGCHNSPKTEFKKGITPWIKGRKVPQEIINKSVETRRRNGSFVAWNKGLKGIHLNPKNEFKKGMVAPNKGRTFPKDIYPNFGSRSVIFPLEDTKIELKIQGFLQQLGIEHLTHFHISEIEHSYRVDILIPSTKTIIEIDGDFIHCNPNKYPADYVRFPSKENTTAKEIWEIDNIRTKELIEKGYRVIRLWGSEIVSMDLNKFCEVLQ